MSVIFVDKLDREWTLAVDYHAMRRIAGETGVDFLTEPPVEALAKVCQSVETMVDAVFAVARPQALRRDIGAYEFAEGFDGQAILRARDALMEGIVGFFPQADQAMLRSAIEMGRAMETMSRAQSKRVCSALQDALGSTPGP
ncbi:MAG: hypothetical protein AAF078_01895 [Planctomycetota bacterium]